MRSSITFSHFPFSHHFNNYLQRVHNESKLKIPDHQHHNQSKCKDYSGLINSTKAEKNEDVSNIMHTLEKSGMKRIYQTKKKAVLLKWICDVQCIHARYNVFYFFGVSIYLLNYGALYDCWSLVKSHKFWKKVEIQWGKQFCQSISGK